MERTYAPVRLHMPISPANICRQPTPLRLFKEWPRWQTQLRRLAAVTGALLCFAAIEGQAADLFTPVAEPPPQSLPADDLTLRSRVVTMDLAQVQRARAAVAPPPGTGAPRTARASSGIEPGMTLTFNLFDDVVVTGLVERTAPTFSGGYSVAGHLVEEPLGLMTLVVNGETVAGTVRLLGETYHIRSIGAGLYAISEVEEPPLRCGVDELHAETDHPH